MFPVYAKSKADVFKFLQFEERFRKALFSWRISVDGRLNLTNKATFSNFFLRGVDEAGGILKIVHYLLSGC